MNKKSKGFAHLFLIVVVVIIGIGGLLYLSWQKGLIKTIPSQELSPTPTIDETANWKTFNSSLFPLLFKYPPHLIVGETKEEREMIFIQDMKAENPTKWYALLAPITITESNNTFEQEVKSLEDRIFPSTLQKNALKLTEGSGYLIKGEASQSFSRQLPAPNSPATDEPTSTLTTAVIATKDTVFFIYFSENSLISEEDFDQILSTFKFIESNKSNACVEDSDCGLLICSGCFNKDYLKTAPPDLACREYVGYHCSCINNLCTPTK